MDELNHPDRKNPESESPPPAPPSTPDASQQFAGNNVRLMMIPVERINASALQLRHDLDEQEIDGDLIASIDRFGLKEPLRVFLKEDGVAELIDGHRRLSAILKLLKKYRASGDPESQTKAARFADLPCLVEDVSPSEKKHLELQILLNAVRKNFSPVEQARYLRRIKDLEPNITQKELGALIPGGKKTQGYVSRLLILAQDDALLRRVENGELTAAEAYLRVKKRQENTKAKKGSEATGPIERDGSARNNASTTTRNKSNDRKDRKADSVLFEWQEKETRVNVVVTGPAKQKENILFVLHSLVRRLDDEARLKPGGD